MKGRKDLKMYSILIPSIILDIEWKGLSLSDRFKGKKEDG
jgi:hypothetical protein